MTEICLKAELQKNYYQLQQQFIHQTGQFVIWLKIQWDESGLNI